MGGLFSSQKDTPPRRSYSSQPSRTTFSSNNDSYYQSYLRQQQERIQQEERIRQHQERIQQEERIRQHQERIQQQERIRVALARQQAYVGQQSLNWGRLNFENSTIDGGAGSTRTTQPPEKSVRKDNLFDISYDDLYNEEPVVTFTQLSQWDSEYLRVSRMITNKRNFKVDSIEKIENMYLEKAYELKKAQKEQTYGYVEESLFFHGTKKSNLDAICKLNFNWRLCKTHKYGKGVSFSPNSTYASNYSDERVYNKIMIVAKVLIAERCSGHEFMELPDEGCDTSQKGEGIVIVKYEDNEFYPVYKINYHLMDDYVGKGNKYHARNGRGIRPIHINSFDDSDIFFN